ncbi:MAG TPA: methyltransferase domain-containing protein [Thermoanaerobaculia bacterium]|nr:methyltransferase domain-containing protein [Thermoanaerobaculia bacterium]
MNEGLEAYGDFAWAFDQSLGRTFFAAIGPLIDALIRKYAPAGNRHLDLACGTGLALEWLGTKGWKSVGVDASLPMLSIAAGRAKHLVGGDLRALPLAGGSFSLVTCLYDSLNHLLQPEDLIAALREAKRLMAGEAVLIFDVNHPDAYVDAWASADPFIAEGSDFRLELHTRYSQMRRLAHARVLGWARRAGRRVAIEEERTQRAYTRRDIERALERSGLRTLEILDFDPFGEIRQGGARRKVKLVWAAR